MIDTGDVYTKADQDIHEWFRKADTPRREGEPIVYLSDILRKHFPIVRDDKIGITYNPYGEAVQIISDTMANYIDQDAPESAWIKLQVRLNESFPPQPDVKLLREACEAYVAEHYVEHPEDGLGPYCGECNSTGGGHSLECHCGKMQAALAATAKPAESDA